MGRRRVVILIGAIASAACGLSLAGTDVAPDGGTLPDGAPLPPSETGTTNDGQTLVPEDGAIDAGLDAPTDAGYAPDGFCATQAPNAFFCDDFDNGGPIPPWTLLDVVSESSVARSQTQSLSGQWALRMFAGTSTAAACRHAAIAKAFNQTFKEASLTFDLFAPAGDTSGLVATFFMSEAPDIYQIDVSLGSNGYIQQDTSDGGPYTITYANFPGTLNPNTWTKVKITYSRPTVGTGTITVALNGSVLGSTTARSTSFTTAHRLFVGTFCHNSPTTSRTLYYDNVVFNLVP